ncbi:hypothetical protein [Nocardioides sp. SR21]|uniref:hypothetical protein n=1 Tax=Nocardioides sp. SR21 TaxID=2919501 RepID=UPI001FA95071|nr:hypothetical protein [Nocardioides sp. SR21]
MTVVTATSVEQAVADGPDLCVYGEKYKKKATTKFEPGPAAFTLAIDNRGNPQAQIETWNVSQTRTVTHGRKKTGSVASSVSAGLKGIAEAKVDATFSRERSTERSVSVTVTTSSQRTFPADTFSSWTRGIYTVTAKAVHLCWKPSHQKWVTVGTDVQKWPVMNAWKFKVIRRG